MMNGLERPVPAGAQKTSIHAYIEQDVVDAIAANPLPTPTTHEYPKNAWAHKIFSMLNDGVRNFEELNDMVHKHTGIRVIPIERNRRAIREAQELTPVEREVTTAYEIAQSGLQVLTTREYAQAVLRHFGQDDKSNYSVRSVFDAIEKITGVNLRLTPEVPAKKVTAYSTHRPAVDRVYARKTETSQSRLQRSLDRDIARKKQLTRIDSMMARGMSNAAMATELGISESSVRALRRSAAHEAELMASISRHPAGSLKQLAAKLPTMKDGDTFDMYPWPAMSTTLQGYLEADVEMVQSLYEARKAYASVVQRDVDGRWLISFDNRIDRSGVIICLTTHIQEHGAVSVERLGHFLDHYVTDRPFSIPDNGLDSSDYGWTSTDDIVTDSDGTQFVIVLPRETHLHHNKENNVTSEVPTTPPLSSVPQAIGDPGAYPTVIDADGKIHEVSETFGVDPAVAADLLANGQQADHPERIEVTPEMLGVVPRGQFIEKAILTVANEFTLPNQGHMDAGEFFVVWFTKVLGNWKALISTDTVSGLYWEVNYSAADKVAYLDTFHKTHNLAVPDENPMDRYIGQEFLIQKAMLLVSANYEVDAGQLTFLEAEDYYPIFFAAAQENWKVVLRSGKVDGTIWEVTYNGAKAETYIDTYVNVESVDVPDTV